MEVEQLQGDGGIGSRARFFDRGLDIEPIWTKKRIGSEQVLRICSGGPRRSPLAEVRGQIFLGSDEFISRHASPERNEIREVPRVQRRAVRPTLEQILGKKDRREIGGHSVSGVRLSNDRDCTAFGSPLRDRKPQAEGAGKPTPEMPVIVRPCLKNVDLRS